MTEPFKELPDIATTQPDRLIKYRISDDRFSAEVLLPGLWYTDFDKKIGGKWTLFSVAKISESVRWIGMSHGYFFYPELFSGNNYHIFIAANKFSFSNKAHWIRDNIWGYKTPFRFIIYLSHVGKTTFTVVQDMFDLNSGLKIQSEINKVVYINAQSRKPAPLPDWFVSKAQQYLQINKIESQSLGKTEEIAIPKDAFLCQVQALQSDCDMNFHVNQAVFLKWCSDAGAVAAVKGQYKFFTEDIGLYALEDVYAQFSGEILRNESVNIYTWEDDHEPRTLHFSFKKDDRLVFSAKLIYYDKKPAAGTSGRKAAPKL